MKVKGEGGGISFLLGYEGYADAASAQAAMGRRLLDQPAGHP